MGMQILGFPFPMDRFRIVIGFIYFSLLLGCGSGGVGYNCGGVGVACFFWLRDSPRLPRLCLGHGLRPMNKSGQGGLFMSKDSS